MRKGTRRLTTSNRIASFMQMRAFHMVKPGWFGRNEQERRAVSCTSSEIHAVG